MAKPKPTMDKQLQWLQDLELKLTIIRQQLVILRASRPGLDDTCQKLAEVIHETRNKRTIAENWREVAEQNGVTKDAE